MPQGIAVSLSTVVLFSASQLLPCNKQGKGPEAAYERFAKKVEEGKCATVYNALDRSSKARLDTYLEIMVGLAFSARDRAEGHIPALSTYTPGAPRLEGDEGQDDTETAKPPPADAGVPDAGLAQPPTFQSAALSVVELDDNELKAAQRREALEKLRDLRGKALFKELCRANMPPMDLLFRESGLSDFEPLPVEAAVIRDDEAELPVKAKKDKKDKKKKGGKEPTKREPVRLVREGTRWRVVLSPIEFGWYQADDGRVVPRFRSPILSLGVEMDANRTPTHAYDGIVNHIEAGQCDDFYDSLDHASQQRMERVTPLMVGFASALGSTDSAAALPTRNPRALVLGLCKRASLNDLKNTGLHLGQVVHEEIVGNRATLTVRARHDKDVTREVFMVREKGEWYLSIEAFAEMLPDDGQDKLAEVEEED